MAVDLSLEMLKLATDGRVRADAAALPLADDTARAVVLINAFLFPTRSTACSAPTASSIHLPGAGNWCVMMRRR
jgi:hypothetical protein